jgi:hypothetical protein
MAEKKQEAGFTVTDRRMFTEEGELRKDIDVESPKPSAGPTPIPPPKPGDGSKAAADTGQEKAPMSNVPPPPSVAEQQAQADAYQQSSRDMDARVGLGGRSAKDFEMTFERFLASLYMTAMLQLGLMHEQGGQPQVDIIGARQTIDTLALLAEKTKGNLTPTEQNFLQNSLYEVRMAYVEVMNALSRPPQPGAATGTGGR